jgi:hypothetical protein
MSRSHSLRTAVASATLLGACLLLPFVAPSAPAAECAGRCEPPTSMDLQKTIEIDAATQRMSGPTSFPEDTAIEYILKHKNPFRFEYDVTVKTEEVDRATLRDAFAILGFPDIEKLLKDAQSSEQQAASAVQVAGAVRTTAFAGAPAACDGVLSTYRSSLESAGQDRETALESAKKSAAPLAKFKKDYVDFQKLVTDSNITTVACPGMCAAAAGALEGLKGLTAPNELGAPVSRLGELQTAIAALPARMTIELTTAQQTQCNGPIKVLTRQSLDFLDGTAKAAEPYKQLLKELADNRASYQANLESLQRTLFSTTAFWSSHVIPGRDEPVTHTLTLTIKDKLDPKAPAQVFQLGTVRAGRAYVTFSAGPGLSFITQKEFGRQAGQVPNGSGGSDLGDVVAVTDQSSSTLGFVGQVNTRLLDIPSVKGALHLSFGASIGSGESDDDIGLFLGPSLSLARDRVFLTLAYHSLETTKLGGTFAVGQPVPEDLEGDIPTSKKRVGGLLLTLTVKMF